MPDDLSYHIPPSLFNSTELERAIGFARTICADLTQIQFLSPYELDAMRRLYGVATTSAGILTPDIWRMTDHFTRAGTMLTRGVR